MLQTKMGIMIVRKYKNSREIYNLNQLVLVILRDCQRLIKLGFDFDEDTPLSPIKL
jgi:polyhydroxyalkanoate synthesis regulator protein